MAHPDHGIDDLQEHLGHSFADPALLHQALTHKSALEVQQAIPQSYERLEFLGDRILGLVIADYLFAAHPAEKEGALARRLNALVSGQTCASVAREISLGQHIHSENGVGREPTQNLLADACEAVIAALYLDGGLDVARAFILTHWKSRLEGQVAASRDPKTSLQEWTQAKGLPIPDYDIVERTGPDHAPNFTVRVKIKGFPAAEASGSSKRKAQQRAAAGFFRQHNIKVEGTDFG